MITRRLGAKSECPEFCKRLVTASSGGEAPGSTKSPYDRVSLAADNRLHLMHNVGTKSHQQSGFGLQRNAGAPQHIKNEVSSFKSSLAGIVALFIQENGCGNFAVPLVLGRPVISSTIAVKSKKVPLVVTQKSESAALGERFDKVVRELWHEFEHARLHQGFTRS